MGPKEISGRDSAWALAKISRSGIGGWMSSSPVLVDHVPHPLLLVDAVLEPLVHHDPGDGELVVDALGDLLHGARDGLDTEALRGSVTSTADVAAVIALTVSMPRAGGQSMMTTS